ncbi:Oidioi.mRNA.OKI2018_I69.chr1.g2827.t1.cds [Oikopleura dioica]|uniref:Choline transporter-like protein n=1 Tax=Oikopleura dioica TaxID=34765 RepID=A0ABN7SWM0_OIKDI|nr:Oidioi.mRNA.OKI2018_I69.chr1.g2827.t1.cds [Oikopleura dioica]
MILFCLVAIKRAKLAAALFAEAGKTVSKIPWILMQGFWMYIALISLWSLWSFSLAFLASSGEQSVDPSTGYVTTNNNKDLWWAYLIQIFGVIWLTEVVFACHQFVLSSAVASYYFTRDKKRFERESPLLTAVLQLVTYHLGSICFGALLVALLRIPQAICSYIYHKAKQTNNKVAQILSKACICCLFCFEKILRFFNATSYAMIAITGQNYCSSACMGAATIASNAFRVGAIAVVGGLTLFLGKVLIAVLSAIIAGVLIQNIPDHPEINSIAVPAIAAAIVGYIIAAGFYATFSTAVDTLLLCFCEDVRVNDGTEVKPYFMNKSLMIFVQYADAQVSHKGSSYEESEPLRTM